MTPSTNHFTTIATATFLGGPRLFTRKRLRLRPRTDPPFLFFKEQNFKTFLTTEDTEDTEKSKCKKKIEAKVRCPSVSSVVNIIFQRTKALGRRIVRPPTELLKKFRDGGYPRDESILPSGIFYK